MYFAVALNQGLTLMHMTLHDNARHLQRLDSAVAGEGVIVQCCLPAVMNLTWYHGFCQDAHDRSRMPTRQSLIRQGNFSIVNLHPAVSHAAVLPIEHKIAQRRMQ
jgi:hypothetical protein